jgi:flagellar motor protein MotB
MPFILVSVFHRVKKLLVSVMTLAPALSLASCSVIPPQQEHYMLRSEYYRALEDQRRLCDAEKAAIRERMTGSESEFAREEGRRFQVENEAESLRKRLEETQARLAEVTGVSERDANAARTDNEALLLTIERLEKELSSAQAALLRIEADRETSTVLFTDIAFARNSKALSRDQKRRLEAVAVELLAADHVSIVGHADDREAANTYALSASRAAEVAAVVRAMGVSASRITVAGRGDADLRSTSSDARERAVNRRVEIVVIDRPNP